jgi:hypothetical protein
MSNQTKAIVAEVKIGSVSIEGLMLPDGTFAVGASQLAELNLVSQDNYNRDLKAILGKDFPLVKSSSELNSKKVNILTLPQVEMVITQLAFKGNEVAQQLMLALIGLSLQQLFCDSFGIKFDGNDRQEWLTTRLQSKHTRRNLTDRLKDVGYTESIDYARTTLRIYDRMGLLNAYQEWKASNSKVPFRDSITPDQLHDVEWAEKAIARYVLRGKTISEAIELL